MSERVRVSVDLLRRASEILLDHLESVEGDVVLLERDLFWAIAPEQIHDAYTEPSTFTIGQLSACVENLEQIVEDPARSTSFALAWLADLLRSAGYVVTR
ncbi:hypothetical protein [Cellulomonas sp. ES6]|uniref:hypothetical protein n=1 Tax=Cellulomonas sp. ES6 TaxID=3039384 RepID=UPI0024B728FA|nr:hypothetical protein [Cellulomonas sp. ES6]WHP16205.1 hypothetical protein P9841_11195 [Cellulomonas sp. ES6]